MMLVCMLFDALSIEYRTACTASREGCRGKEIFSSSSSSSSSLSSNF